MSESDKETISFYLRKDLVKKLDEAAASIHMNRSQFVEWLLTEALPLVGPVAELMKTVFKKASKPE